MSPKSRTQSVECVWPAGATLGEAPVWCVDKQVLYWVDIDGKAVMRLNPKTGARDTFPQNYEIGCIVKRESGGFIAAVDAGLALLDDDLANLEIFADPENAIANNRFNDGKCDRQGRFWTGSLDRDEEAASGSLYCVSTRNSVTAALSGLIVPNGTGWSPDDSVMYFTESGTGVIYAYDFDPQSGAMENRREFAVIDPSLGAPDGLCVDADGFVWSAHWDGWRVTRYDPDGTIERIVELPVPQVTSVAFGGANLGQLYITTARYDLSEDQLKEAPLSGGLFVHEPGVVGLPEVPFRD